MFDLDITAGPDVVAEDLQRLRELLDDASITYIVSRSGPSGGHHVWARFPAGVDPTAMRKLAYALATLLPSLDTGTLTNPSHGCARPPGSPHRHGGAATLVAPADVETAAAILSEGNPSERLQLLFDALPTSARESGDRAIHGRQTTPAHHQVATHGDAPRLTGKRRALTAGSDKLIYGPPGADASATLWAILLRCAHARWTLADVRVLADDPGAQGLQHLQSKRAPGGRQPRSTAEREALLARQWARAVEYAAQTPLPQREKRHDVPDPTTTAIAAIEDAARAQPWRWATPAGPADREALRALCLIALACRSTTVSLDCRRWSALTGFGKSTMAAAARRLACDHPIDGPAWITCTKEAEGRMAATWTLLPPVLAGDPMAEESVTRPASESTPVEVARTQGRKPAPRQTVSDTPPSSGVLGRSRQELTDLLTTELKTAAHDIWTPRGGLGHACHRTYAAARGAAAVTTSILSDETGYSRATIRRHLRTLCAHGLLAATEPNSYGPGPLSLDQAAAKLGVNGTGARRLRNYIIDRELYAWWIDEQQWRTSPGKHGRRCLPRQHPGGQGAIPVRQRPRATYGAFPTRRSRTGPGRADYAEAARRVRQHFPARPDDTEVRAGLHVPAPEREWALAVPPTATPA
ncbi:hypothetical protein [Polymorphospora sp. NPDC050346]|uniref:hypothetical protein n=1 Tax=Polymorphospora sp. NPDC050346 TaxID=3155780 RepID=UPI00340ED59E